MKRALFSVAVLISSIAPVAAHATSVSASATHSICVPVIVETPEGPVEGVLCFPQGGRV